MPISDVNANGIKPVWPANVRSVRVGLLGLGAVGQAVVCSADSPDSPLRRCGIRLEFVQALVHDVHRARPRLQRQIPLTTQGEAFLAQKYDLVIETLVGVEPACTLVRRLLENGTPVVTANKALVATKGDELAALSAGRGTPFMCEASAIAGLPYLTQLSQRPYAASVSCVTGIMNGTTNFILSAMEQDRMSFDEAVRTAQALGYAETDPSRDLDGIDAAEKLVIFLQHLGVRGLNREAFEVRGIRDVTGAHLAQARAFGGAIKLIAHAVLHGSSVEAYVAPSFVPDCNPLAHLERELNGVRLHGPQIGTLCHTGPGAGPDVTAGTLLDDVLGALRGNNPWGVLGTVCQTSPSQCQAPETGWLLQLSFSNQTPTWRELAEFLGAQGIWFSQTAEPQSCEDRRVFYVITLAARRERLENALASLRDTTHCQTWAIRALED